MGSLTASASSPLFTEKQGTTLFPESVVKMPSSKRIRSHFPVARLLGQSIFESSKLKVMFLGVDERKHPGKLPRTYTFTHSDLTSMLTLSISQTINISQLQGWYNKLQRDEVIAMWKKVKGNMSLHVHCHISGGGHFLLDLCAGLRSAIFSNELPVVLRAFIHGDGNLLNQFPELNDALVWVYFHSNINEFDKVECWGPLKDAGSQVKVINVAEDSSLPEPCCGDCDCCFSPGWSRSVGRRWGKINVVNSGPGLGPSWGL